MSVECLQNITSIIDRLEASPREQTGVDIAFETSAKSVLEDMHSSLPNKTIKYDSITNTKRRRKKEWWNEHLGNL